MFLADGTIRGVYWKQIDVLNGYFFKRWEGNPMIEWIDLSWRTITFLKFSFVEPVTESETEPSSADRHDRHRRSGRYRLRHEPDRLVRLQRDQPQRPAPPRRSPNPVDILDRRRIRPVHLLKVGECQSSPNRQGKDVDHLVGVVSQEVGPEDPAHRAVG